MLIEHLSHRPLVDDTAYIAPTAVLVGRVGIGTRSRIMFGAVINSEDSSVDIGECSIICENSVIRATTSCIGRCSVIIGANVFIGPHATVLGCTIEPGSYLATGATALQGARIHSGAVVAVGALVHVNTVIPENFFVPPNNVAIGDPVRIYSPDEKESMAQAIMSLDFARVAFGIDAQNKSRADIFREAAQVRSKQFGSHMDDVVLE